MGDNDIRLIQSGVDRLPFSGCWTPEEALKVLKSSMNAEKYSEWNIPFSKEYETWYRALLMVRERFEFYLYEALPRPDLYDRIGSHKRALRLVFAAHRCIVKAEELRNKLGRLVGEYLEKCRRQAECELWNIEPFNAQSVGYFASSCELTGICVCQNRGTLLPYMDGCNGDTTLLLPFREYRDHSCEE